jgi:hypothetical protein
MNEVPTMTGFEFAQTFSTIEEKLIVLFVDATKTACKMAGIDFDNLTTEEQQAAVLELMRR